MNKLKKMIEELGLSYGQEVLISSLWDYVY